MVYREREAQEAETMKKEYIYALCGIVGFALYFHRCPERTPDGDGILAPCDGIITGREENTILVYLSLFDVHCQRAPCAGVVTAVAENTITIEDAEQRLHKITLMQGTVGRSYRVTITREVGDTLHRGAKIGHIALGSHVRYVIPPEYTLKKTLGDVLFAGRTVIAE